MCQIFFIRLLRELGYNSIELIPSELGQLIKLEKISLNDNELITLPCEIETCENLQEIDIVRNKLISLPRNILDLPNLNRLYISSNELDIVEKTFKGLSKKVFICALDL